MGELVLLARIMLRHPPPCTRLSVPRFSQHSADGAGSKALLLLRAPVCGFRGHQAVPGEAFWCTQLASKQGSAHPSH